jgi:very-short-patch-repair endonuclease
MGLAIAVVIVFVLVAAARSKGKPRAGASPQYVRRRLMTARELEFFESLRTALPEAVIHVQVAMSALVDVKGGRPSDRNRFDRKVFDFVVCRAAGDVLYAVELDDKTHGSASSRKRDAVKDDIAASAGLRVVRYQSVKTDPSTLRRDFDSLCIIAA